MTSIFSSPIERLISRISSGGFHPSVLKKILFHIIADSVIICSGLLEFETLNCNLEAFY
jgi:hypothetical protein